MRVAVEVAARLVLAVIWALVTVIVILIAIPYLIVEFLFNRVNHAR